MKEVETLVEVFSKKEDVLKKLQKFDFVGKKEVLDVYFFDPKRKNLKPKNNKLTECFRIRKKDSKAYIAHKTDNFNKQGIWTYSDEEETEIKDFETMRTILTKLGFEELIIIDNFKHTFLTEKYEIVLEEVKNTGLFLEVERLKVNDDENIGKIKKEIFEFIKTLKIKTSEELNMGKPELMLKKLKTTLK
jgi:predicted adenylyl cyclase CyaB